MEVISGVASAFAIVSLSVQLLDKIDSFCGFWERVQGAPKYTLELVHELRLLEAVVKQIQQKEKEYGPDATLTSILESVSAQVDALQDTMARYQPGVSSDERVLRTWSSFKLSLKSNQVMRFRLSLSETKATLLLAQVNLNEKVQYRLHEQTMTALTEGLTRLNVHKASGIVSTELNEPLNLQSHLASLKSEMLRVTASVPHSWLQSGMQAVIDKAVQNLADKLNDETANIKIDAHSPYSPGENVTSELYSNPNADVESAKDLVRLENNSRRRRSRHLGPVFHGSYASIMPSIFGTIYFNTSRFYIFDPTIAEDPDYSNTSNASEIETQFTFYPARWLMWWGLKYGLRVVLYREGTSWKNSLQTFHTVSDDSLIFKFCEDGNVMAVNTLLTTGKASPWDTNSKGWTPLHIASWRCNVPLIKSLLRVGSNREALTFDFPNGNYEHWYNSSPAQFVFETNTSCGSALVTAATVSSTTQVPPHQRIEALRLLLDDIDFTNHESQAWKMVLVVLERERASTGLCTTTEVSEWILDTFLAELRASHSPPIVAWLITFCLESPNLLRRVLDLSGDLVNISVNEGGYTPMHGGIAMNFPNTYVSGIKMLLQRGANPHLVRKSSLAFGGDELERFDTPTSLAMRRSSSFFKWRQVIREMGYDVNEFVDNELKEAPLVASGWHLDSLTKLFQSDFKPHELPQDLCEQCGRYVYHTFDRDEMWWEELLAEIKGVAHVLEMADALSKPGDVCKREDDSLECISPVSTSSTISTDSSEDIDLCWKCVVMRKNYGVDYERGRL